MLKSQKPNSNIRVGMRDIEQLIRDWEVAAESDFPPPVVTDEERQALAVAFLKTQRQRHRIHAWPILGMSLKQTRQAVALDERMMVIQSFIDETLLVDGLEPDAQTYIGNIKKQTKL